mgnify:CR=1 FL=1
MKDKLKQKLQLFYHITQRRITETEMLCVAFSVFSNGFFGAMFTSYELALGSDMKIEWFFIGF